MGCRGPELTDSDARHQALHRGVDGALTAVVRLTAEVCDDGVPMVVVLLLLMEELNEVELARS